MLIESSSHHVLISHLSSAVIMSSGEQTRSFQYVSDLVRGLILLMNSNLSQPCNIGNPDETTIKQFAERIQTLINPDSAVVYQSAGLDDPRKRKPDITRATTEIGWQPRIDVGEGLGFAIKYFKEEEGFLATKTVLWLDVDGNPIIVHPIVVHSNV
jgi:nucleoside-diphosphate-sugar epimerase